MFSHFIIIILDKSQLELYKIAIESTPESFELWSSYNDWLQLQWQGSLIKTDELEELYLVSGIIFIY